MNSIRPLVTITILFVVGAYLYMKINEGPARPAGANGALESTELEDLPPLAATSAPAGSDVAAPWAGSAMPATAVAVETAPPDETVGALAPSPTVVAAGTGVAPGALPAVPAIPDLPEVASTANAAAPDALNSVPLPNGLPANVPVARYPGDLDAGGVGALNEPPSGMQPITPAAAGQSVPIGVQPEGVTGAPQDRALPGRAAALPTMPPSEPLVPNPLRPSAPPVAAADPNAASIYAQAPPISAASAPGAQSFVASWPIIQQSLERGELAQALEQLSSWHNDPSLAPADAQQVEALLSQLAGTVVYSTEHRLEPARVVKQGETLETIAQEYNVPWQLLAKINGISAANQVQPGQELKVVRGPFSAVVDLARNELTLMVGGRYAGKFPIGVPQGTMLPAGDWAVAATRVPGGPTSAYQAPGSVTPTAVDQPLIVLQQTNVTGTITGSLVIGSESPAVSGGAGSPVAIPHVKVSPADAVEIADILSVGSPVVIRR